MYPRTWGVRNSYNGLQFVVFSADSKAFVVRISALVHAYKFGSIEHVYSPER